MSNNKIELSGIFSEGYGFVPKKLMKAKDITQTTKVVLCYLLSYTGAGVTCFPQIKDIANDLGLSNRTIIRSIKLACDNGYLSKHQENRGAKIGKKNKYELLFMYDFGKNKHVTKTSRAKLASDKNDLASDKNNKGLVTPGNSNSNNNKSNINNNNNKEYEIPSSLKAFKEFDSTWKEWIIFRSEIKKKLVPSTAKKQLKMLSEQPDPIAVINKSIECGWHGLFSIEKKINGKKYLRGNEIAIAEYYDSLPQDQK